MSSNEQAIRTGEGARFGIWSLVASVLAILGVAMIGLSTFTAAGSALEPPDWMRVVVMPLFPAGALASAVLGVMALRRGEARGLPIAGLAITGVAVAAFVVMIFSVGY